MPHIEHFRLSLWVTLKSPSMWDHVFLFLIWIFDSWQRRECHVDMCSRTWVPHELNQKPRLILLSAVKCAWHESDMNSLNTRTFFIFFFNDEKGGIFAAAALLPGDVLQRPNSCCVEFGGTWICAQNCAYAPTWASGLYSRGYSFSR